MKTPADDAGDVARYATEYERLRSQINGAPPERPLTPASAPLRGIGLALLLRDGLPGWIRAVQRVVGEAAACAAGTPALRSALPAADAGGSGASSSSCPLVGPARQRDIATLLASLVLSTRAAQAAAMKEPSPCH